MDLLHLKLKIKHQIALCFCGLIILALSSFWLLAKVEINQTLQQQADGLGNTLAGQAANSVRELVLTNDLLSLNVILDQLTRNENILSVAVFNIDGQLLASSGSNPAKLIEGEIDQDIYVAQITLQDSIAGTAQLQLDNSKIASSMQHTALYFWSILGFSLALATAIAFTLATHFSTPILGIIQALQAPNEHTLPTQPQGSDEITLLQSTCSELLEQYQQSVQAQQSLIKSSEIKQPVESQPLKTMASILIVKVVNINTAIELLHPSTLSSLLEEYLFYLKQAAKLYGGNIQRVNGESVMLSFDTRHSDGDHSFNAICCAQLFLMLMSNLSRKHRSNASQALEFRLGIHSGETFIASSSSAPTETFIGRTVETSYFLCNQSQPGQLIISEASYSQAGGEEKLASAGSTEITMPATDNMSFMAYSVNVKDSEHTDILNKQSQHILPSRERV